MAILPSIPPREIITFDYTPVKEAPPGSANVTFAVVGARLGTPTQQGVTQLPSQAPPPLFKEGSDLILTACQKNYAKVA